VTTKANSFGPWEAFAVLAIYMVVLLVLGVTLLQRRDA
jgi:hypothetical protein